MFIIQDVLDGTRERCVAKYWPIGLILTLWILKLHHPYTISYRMIDWNYVYCLQPTKLPIIDSKSWLILSISLGCLVFSYFGILQCSSWPEGYNVTSRKWSVNPPLADGMSHICAFVPRAPHIGAEHAIYILHKNGVSCWSHWQDQWMIQCQTKVNRISCFSSLCCAFSTFDWNIVFINHCWQMDNSELFLLYFLVFYGDDAPAPTRGKPAPVASVVLC